MSEANLYRSGVGEDETRFTRREISWDAKGSIPASHQ